MLHARPLTILASITAVVVAASSALGGCGGGGESPTTSSGNTSAAATTGSGGAGSGSTASAGGAGGMAPVLPQSKTITGDVTWKVTFDATAQAAGAKDCSYTRHYEGVEDRSAPWLCPTCEIMFHADVTMTAGATDCFPQVSTSATSKTEWLGYENGKWHRGLGGPMGAQGTADVTDTGVTTANHVDMQDAPVGGTLAFDVAGQLTFGVMDGDPLHGFTPPDTYACTWPKSDAPPYTGDYVLAKGAIVPDAILKDTCDETVRLHDFKGDYLIVEMSARDCPPCQQMATGEEKFIADMAAQGIPVHVITLLCPALDDTIGTTTNAMLKAWTKKFKLTSPVLADRGWGLAEFGPAIGDTIGYPSWALVDPDLKVIDFGSGFGSFDDFEMAILADKK